MPTEIVIRYHEAIVFGIVLVTWSFIRPFISELVNRYMHKRRESDFLLTSDFLKICSDNRKSCIILGDFSKKLDGLTNAMKVVIIHTVSDKEKQDEALRLLI